jgi:hypothetical protein
MAKRASNRVNILSADSAIGKAARLYAMERQKQHSQRLSRVWGIGSARMDRVRSSSNQSQSTHPMTAGMKKPGPIWTTVEAAAVIVRRSTDRGGLVVYTPERWQTIMFITRTLPATIFSRAEL